MVRLARQDAPGAVDNFSAVPERSPSHAAALRQRGMAHVRMGEHERARSDLDAAICADPRDPLAHRDRAPESHTARRGVLLRLFLRG